MKKILLLGLVVVLVMSAITIASAISEKNQNTADPGLEEHQWNNGKKSERVFASLDEVAIFRNGKSAEEMAKSFDQNAVVTKDYDYLIIISLPQKMKSADLDAKIVNYHANTGHKANFVFYKGDQKDESRMVLTGEIVVHFKNDWDENRIKEWAKSKHIDIIQKYPFSSNTYLFKVGPGLKSLDIADQIYQSGEVIYAYPNWWKVMNRKAIPNDPLFPNQWHFLNTGQGGGTSGEDVNITSIWDTFTGSSNEVIAIVDDGLEIGHEDIAPNVLAGYSYDYVDGDGDPTAGAHGTSVGGVAAAKGFNSIGVTGAGPNTKLVGYRLLDAWTANNEADALTRNMSIVDIYSNSWGPSDAYCSGFYVYYPIMDGPGPLTKDAFANGVTNGRGGKGSIYTWAGGNGNNANNLCDDNSNYDGYANSRYIMAIAASNNYGTQSYYSEDGANILVNTPSSGGSRAITTTDRTGSAGYDPGNYTGSFGGTSSATPLASGIISLMLQANPTLSWRDVRLILAQSAKKNNPTDSDWTTNAAGYHVNHKYGFGRADAGKAVSMASGWTNVGPEVSTGVFRTPNIAIPDNNAVGISDSITIDQNIKIEFVEIYFTAADHTYWGDLDIELVSPSGTKSKLATKHNVADRSQRYNNWTFGSVRHMGESSQGTWTLNVKDLWAADTGTLQKWGLKIYGTEIGGGSGPSNQLHVSVSESPDPITSGSTSQATVHVTRECGTDTGDVCALVIPAPLIPAEGVNVGVSTTGGSLSYTNGVTDANGNFTTTYTAPSVTSSTVFTISATASKTGYIDGSGSDQITVNPSGGTVPNVVISSARFDALGTDAQYNINGEWVKITNRGTTSQSLTGWQLLNKTNNVLYTIPTFTLGAGRTVTVYSGTGTNSATRLYMRYNRHVWANSGECARLKDNSGNLVSEYCI